MDRNSKTAIQVALVRQDGEDLVSRSQAKRLMARCELFQRVTLDFNLVSTVGPAFADEIFRVFALKHPGVELEVLNASEEVRRRIDRARTARETS